MRYAFRHIMLVLLLIGFAGQISFAVNAAGVMVCCDPEMKAVMKGRADVVGRAVMSDDQPCHDADVSCDTCCMDAISQVLIIDRFSAVSFHFFTDDKNIVQPDQFPNSVEPDFTPPPPNA